MTNINEKSTKATILAAYEKAQAEIKALKAQQLNPKEIAVEKRKAEVVESANNTIGTSLTDIVSALRNTVDKSLNELMINFDEKKNEFLSLEEAIKAKDEELKEIYAIEREAQSLAALVNSHDVLRKQHSEENEITLEKFQEELYAVRKQIEEEKKHAQEQAKQAREALKQEQDRAKAEFDYNFAREQKIKRDELADEIAVARKEIAEKEEELREWETNVGIRENEVDALEEKVTEIPALIEAAKQEAADKAKKDAEKSFVFEKRAIEANKDAEIRVLQHQVDLLTASLAQEKESHKATMEQLNAAYGRLENVANSAVEGSKAQDTITKLLSTVSEKQGK